MKRKVTEIKSRGSLLNIPNDHYESIKEGKTEMCGDLIINSQSYMYSKLHRTFLKTYLFLLFHNTTRHMNACVHRYLSEKVRGRQRETDVGDREG